jgi:hypothetical protein
VTTLRSLPVAAVRAAVTAAGAGLAAMTILALIGWIAAPHPGTGLGGVLRTAAVLWLVAHHVAVQVQGAGRIGMLPLGLVIVPGSLLWWAGRSLAKGHALAGARQVVSLAAAVAVPYSVIAGVLAVVSRTSLARASLPQAVLAGFAVAFVATWFGAARGVASWPALAASMTARSRSMLAGAAGSFAVLGAAGFLATAIALANHEREFSALYRQLDPGLIGAVLLLLAQLAYLPNAVLWAIAYLLGPGFAVGAGTVVSPTGSVLGRVPAFPLLAALPGAPHASGPGWLTGIGLAVPYVAGITGGLLVVRLAPQATVDSAAIRGFCAGAGCGLTVGLLAAFAGGPLGDGRLSAVGPSAWQVAVVGVLELGIASAVSAGAASWVRGGVLRRVTPASVPPPPAPRPGSYPDDQDGAHVIYLDRWAADQDPGPDSQPARSRGGGPSALP